MIPKFLQPERVLFASLELLRARLTDSAPPALTLVPAPVCAWCPDFNPANQPAGISHGICQACSDRLAEAEALADADERLADADDDRDDDAGARCTAACGFCGRCS